jgi:hypothetical protein
MWFGLLHLKHLSPLVVVPRLGGPVVIGAQFGFVDWVVFRGINDPLYQVVLPSVPRPKKTMDPLAAVLSNKKAL